MKKKPKGKRGGDCFRQAYHALLAVPGALLCHGLVYSHAWSRFIAHAWIEMGPDVVYDAASGTLLRTDDFVKIGRPKNVREFTLEDANRMAVKTGHYGPWRKI